MFDIDNMVVMLGSFSVKDFANESESEKKLNESQLDYKKKTNTLGESLKDTNTKENSDITLESLMKS